MTLLFVLISVIDLYSKLLILFVVIDILTKAEILNYRSTVVQKIDAVLSMLFTKPLDFIRQRFPHIIFNIDLSPLLLLFALWIVKYILYLMT